MKCGLLPLCYEAMTVGEIAYSEYTGGAPDDAAHIQHALSSDAKVCLSTQLLLRNCSNVTANFNITFDALL